MTSLEFLFWSLQAFADLFIYYVLLMEGIKKHRGKNNWQENLIRYFWFPVFLIFDFLVNQIVMTVYFAQLPKELLVTSRLKRWRKEYEHQLRSNLSWFKKRRLDFALWICEEHLDHYDTLTGDHC